MNTSDLPKRKHPRLDCFDYSSNGAYFVTICTQNRRCILSRAVPVEKISDSSFRTPVGRGLAPAAEEIPDSSFRAPVGRGLAPDAPGDPQFNIVGRGLAPAENVQIEYTSLGTIVEEQLLSIESRYPSVSIDRYVIMPNHIHAVFLINNETAGASPRPTLMDVVCTFKSMTTRECRKIGFEGKLFQTSFYDHVIRDRSDYDEIIKYIHENPAKWFYDELYLE